MLLYCPAFHCRAVLANSVRLEEHKAICEEWLQENTMNWWVDKMASDTDAIIRAAQEETTMKLTPEQIHYFRDIASLDQEAERKSHTALQLYIIRRDYLTYPELVGYAVVDLVRKEALKHSAN